RAHARRWRSRLCPFDRAQGGGVRPRLRDGASRSGGRHHGARDRPRSLRRRKRRRRYRARLAQTVRKLISAQHGGQTMTIIRLAALATALLLLSVAAGAGDMATVQILGFSDDGGIFAFEEYGVQDGSGFPYANRYYIDTANDTFLPGTPVRVRLDDEQASVEQARQSAKARGDAIISDEELTRNIGFTAGWNAVTELSADPHRMLVNPRPIMPALDDALEFRLEELHLQHPESCDDLGERIVGFRLLRIGTVPGEETQTVHE